MERVIPYQNPLVRDLDWALSSPPLMKRTDSGIHWPDVEWFNRIHDGFQQQLEQLEKHPQTLDAFVSRQADQRLGSYFETLWRFWLTHNPRYRLLHANLALRSAQRTIGEFDFLVSDLETGKTLHWEIAVKFYLGDHDTRHLCNWLGPARRDRLDIKTDRLLQHQARLSEHPAARALLKTLGLRVDETWLIVKGRLFYPVGTASQEPVGAHPLHLRGFWVRQQALTSLDPAYWLELDRRQWLATQAGHDRGSCMDTTALIRRWRDKPVQQPVCVARIGKDCEIERGFIVPNDWGQNDPHVRG